MGRVGFLPWVEGVRGRAVQSSGARVTTEQCHRCDPPGTIQRLSSHMAHACAHAYAQQTYLSRLLGRARASPSIRVRHLLFLSCTDPLPSAEVCLHRFIHLSVFPALQLLCDALSSPALQLHSKEQNKITSHFLPFTCFFLPFLFFFSFPSGTVPFCKCLEAENVSGEAPR